LYALHLSMLRSLPLLLALILGTPLFASFASRDAYVPIAGRSAGAGGREFFTDVVVMNVSDEPASVTLAFLRGQQANPTPMTFTQRLAPHESRTLALPPYLLGGDNALGALRITSTRDVIATAHVYGRGAGESDARNVGASLDAMPAAYAIGSGESAIVQGIATRGARAKLYLVETVGHPLSFRVDVLDGSGKTLVEKRFFINSREQRTFDVAGELANDPLAAALRLHGVAGSGKILGAVGAVNVESLDTTIFAMGLPARPRHRMPLTELTAYAILTFALLAAAVRSIR
jgi:hypothetical protein